MTNKLHMSFVSAFILASFLLISAFAALPAGAQTTTPKDSCTLVKDVNIKDKAGATKRLSAGVTVSDGTDSVVDITTGTATIKQWGLVCLINTINVIVDWIFIVLLIVAVALIAIAGFMWMTAGGNAERQGQAGKMILAALIGIIIAVLARVIPGIVTGILL